MRVLQVVPHIDEEASGPSYSVPRLSQALAREGAEVELACLAAPGPVAGVTTTVCRQWPILQRFAISPELTRHLREQSRQIDLVHNHSLWSMVNVAAGFAIPTEAARVVVSPRGTLNPVAFRHHEGRKRLLWPLQRRLLLRAHLLHATSESEYHHIRARGLTAPVVIVPNGVDVPDLPQDDVSLEGEERTLLFLSRLHPKKNLLGLLRAWRALEGAFPDWSLRIVGKGDPRFEAQIQREVLDLRLSRVELPGVRYGVGKSAEYFNADVFVLPTLTENFGMVVAEALAHGCPVVVTKGAPWEDVEARGCGWWIDHGDAALISGLSEAMSRTPRELKAMGIRGRAWMKDDFGWDAVGKRVLDAYDWTLNGGAVPPWVRTD